jgi:hypothetical protein
MRTALGSGASEPTASHVPNPAAAGVPAAAGSSAVDSALDDPERSPAVQSALGQHPLPAEDFQPDFEDASQSDLSASDVDYDKLPIIVDARRRRNKCLKDANLDSNTDLGHERVQAMWKEWQNEYCVAEHPDLARSKHRGAFQKYCHKTIGKKGEHVLRAVLQTGHSAELIRSNIMGLVSAKWNESQLEKVQTCRSSLQTPAQKAKKARRNAQWVQNKAAIYARSWELCERCYGSVDHQLRVCQLCKYKCCTNCLRSDRLCCKCYKRDIPATDRQRMSLSMHPRAASLFDHARYGGPEHRAATLTSLVNLQPKPPSTAYERFLSALVPGAS